MNGSHPEKSRPPDIGLNLDATAALHAEINILLSTIKMPIEPRADVGMVMAGLAIEHVQSFAVLLRNEKMSSAMALVRIQFEAIVRAIWLAFAATDAKIEKIVAARPESQTTEPDIFPIVSVMLGQLEEKGNSLAIQRLSAYKAAAWGAMNSYTHGSLRPIIRHRNGYQPELLSQTLQNMNGIALQAVQLVLHLAERQDLNEKIIQLARAHPDCLPAFPVK